MTINEEHPFGLYVSYPRFFEGERQEDRLKWYATTTAKDVILSAKVCKQRWYLRSGSQICVRPRSFPYNVLQIHCNFAVVLPLFVGRICRVQAVRVSLESTPFNQQPFP